MREPLVVGNWGKWQSPKPRDMYRMLGVWKTQIFGSNEYEGTEVVMVRGSGFFLGRGSGQDPPTEETQE